jgi:phospholipid transport system substrate-binding protein
MKTTGMILGAIALVTLATAPAAADEAAETFVQELLDRADPYLNAPTEEERLAGIEELVDEYVDMRRVSRFVLGQFARRLTDEQKAAYDPLFRQYATQVYQNVLSEYSGQRLAVSGSIDRSERDIIVNSKVVNPVPGDGLADVVFHWRVYRSRDGELSIVDAGADNVWLALEQRSTFTSIISNNGGPPAGVDALIADLKEKTGE